MNQQIKIQQKSPKLLSQRIRKRHYKTLGTSVINVPLSPLYLFKNIIKQKNTHSGNLRDKTMADKLKYIPNDYKQDHWLKSYDTTNLEPKYPKFLDKIT